MDYQKHYDALIKKYGKSLKPENSINYERHNVVPTYKGGKHSLLNIVYLPVKCHFLAHKLQTKIYESDDVKYVLEAMCNECKWTSKMYEEKRTEYYFRKDHRKIQTDFGIFETIEQAAKAEKASIQVIQKKIKSKQSKYKNYKYFRNENHPTNIKALTPHGVFNSMRSAERFYDLPHRYLQFFASGIRDDFFYLEDCHFSNK